MDDDKVGDLLAKSSKVFLLRSRPLLELSKPEREQIDSYFKQNTPAQLFLVDIRGNVYRSNTVPFARGLYEQSVYDALRAAAASDKSAPVLAKLFR
jgi:hypothetical protein